MDNYVFDDKDNQQMPDVSDEEETTGDDGAFMRGYNDEDEPEECAECGSAIKTERKIVLEIEDDEYTFCSKDCANEFEESLGK